MPVCFLMKERKGVGLDGRGTEENLGGTRGRNHNHNIVYKISILNKRK